MTLHALRSPRTALSVLLILTIAASQVGCGAGWNAVRQPWPDSLPPRQQVQVWQHGAKLQLHALRVSTDSISGVPFHEPIECDSCRVTVPRIEVDSLRRGSPERGFLRSIGVVAMVFYLLGALLCGPLYSSCPSD